MGRCPSPQNGKTGQDVREASPTDDDLWPEGHLAAWAASHIKKAAERVGGATERVTAQPKLP
ncbi:hypothetical protein UC34_10185 [Pandoraea vervacti]|uniref:Uncharacterized protein n=1 Tax=Pandoraea vervacti TaxID=656178 RepID=A0ABM5SXJ6_9BURK|nr:hypothetical protein UC34_10185 [Pandoraea vervacti]